jgi:excisionase family DNA binding protein
MTSTKTPFNTSDLALPDKPLYRVDEVADHFNVTTRTVYLWIDHGLLEAEKYNRMIRIPRESVVNFRLRSKLDPVE